MGAMRFPPHHYLLHGVLSELKVDSVNSLGARSLIVTNMLKDPGDSFCQHEQTKRQLRLRQQQVWEPTQFIIINSFSIILIILINITIISVIQYQNPNQRQKRWLICTSHFLLQGITLLPLWALDQMQRLMKNLYWR